MSQPGFKRRMTFGRAIGIGLVLVVVGVAVWYWAWSSRTSRTLNDRLAALRAAGEPVTATDLIQPHVPDSANAALLLRNAARAIDKTSDAWQAYEQLEWPDAQGTTFPLRDDELSALARVVDENAAVFSLVAGATRLTEVDWRIDYTVGVMNILLPDLSEQRELAKLLRAAALVAHARGDDAQAIEHVEQIGFISRAVGSQPLLVSSLVSIGCNAIRVDVLGEMAPTLHIADDDSRAVSPQRLRQIIDDLLDARRATAQTLGLGLRGERALQQDLINDLMQGRLGISTLGAPTAPAPAQPQRGSRLAGMALSPMLRDNAVLMLERMDDIIANLDAPDWPTFCARIPPEPPQLAQRSWRYLFANMLLPALTRPPEVGYRFASDAHLAAAALAIRWYALEHGGRLPESLDELVPKYLPHVPRDLLAGGDNPITYLPDPDRARVYHVGPNGEDDGGLEPDPNVRGDKRTGDRVVHLAPQPRPATQPDERS